MSRRRVVYVTGTRADFGLAEEMLRRIHEHPKLELRMVVTGMHRVAAFGATERLVEGSGLPIGARVDMLVADDSRAAMATGIGVGIIGLTQALVSLAPDLVLLLGDRGEMLAGAIAAVHLGLAVAHCHGGEVSGTIDESVRHAISKLAHVHFTSTARHAERLIRMGERADRVFVTGAPGLDAIRRGAVRPRDALCTDYGLDRHTPWAVVIYHPDTIAGNAAAEIDELLAGADEYPGQLVVFEPNADAGRQGIVDRLEKFRARPGVTVLCNVPRPDFLGFLAHAQLMVGNSSSGIIEAPSLGVPVVNVGRRQDLRERGGGVLDVPAERHAVADAVSRACGDQAFLARGREATNPYGDGRAGERIAELLAELGLGLDLLDKRMAY